MRYIPEEGVDWDLMSESAEWASLGNASGVDGRRGGNLDDEDDACGARSTGGRGEVGGGRGAVVWSARAAIRGAMTGESADSYLGSDAAYRSRAMLKVAEAWSRCCLDQRSVVHVQSLEIMTASISATFGNWIH